MDPQTGQSSKIPAMPVPPTITMSNFTAARLKEIQAMRKSLSENNGTKMAFQKIPRHMRRRTMSHVVKRLPRRIREIHMSQMKKSGLPPKSKRPSRKHRRRPSNLLSDYARRQRRIKWLDTHIWHAKRFHMTEKWGYKLPKQPCDKSFRACYRATSKHCLIQDISYIKCIEINGVYEEIVSKLEMITDKTIGLTFAAKSVNAGKKYGQITIFEPSGQQKKPIGQIDYLWNSVKDNSSKLRQLWLFVHPSFYKHLYGLLSRLYEVYDIDGNAGHIVILKELEYDIGRFRLTGPLSTAVLKNAFRVIEFKDHELPDFLKSYQSEALSNQNAIFTELTNGSYVPPNAVLSLIVHDPRLSHPKKRTKAMLEDEGDYGDFECFEENLAVSPLFDGDVRKFCRENKISNAELCKIRSQFLIPEEGFSVASESKIPVILLWRSGNKSGENQGYSHGWDVIVPSSYSQAFFLTFVMWGARAGGLRETESIAFEKSQSDILYPDTAAGEQEECSISDSLRDKFFRLPPNKRTNFNKFSIVSPYCFNWKLLIKDWSGEECQSFSVIRNRVVLNSIESFLTKKQNTLDISLPPTSLVPIKIVPVLRGVCAKFSVICIPTESDLKTLPLEPKKSDVLAQKRKKLRIEHRNLLQKLRRRRKRARSAKKPVTPTDVTMLREYQTEMRNLWLPKPETIKNSCSRPVMGFIKHGGFSYTIAQSKGLGYISASSLVALRSLKCRNKVLIRSPNSRVYRLAVMSVVVD